MQVSERFVQKVNGNEWSKIEYKKNHYGRLIPFRDRSQTIYQLLFGCTITSQKEEALKNDEKKQRSSNMKLKRFNNVIITGRTVINENNIREAKRREKERKTVSKSKICVAHTWL